MPNHSAYDSLFQSLRAILKPHAKACVVDIDTDADYYLNSKKLDRNDRPIFFAGVSVNKISVSFYLMPISLFPNMLKSVSPDLRRRLHGKSCFRFSEADPQLLRELKSLAKAGAARYRSEL